MRIEEIHYRLNWRTGGRFPGHHRSYATGDAVEFRGHAPLLAHPDPRRVDAGASMRDPLEQLLVRIYRQRSAIAVYMLADLSASMGFAGRGRKFETLADFTASLDYSAYRASDSFAFIGCDEAVRRDFYVPLTRRRGAGRTIANRLQKFEPDGAHARGLLDALALIKPNPSLIFVLSDFLFPLDLASRLFDKLARHWVVPVALTDSAEHEQLPAAGLVRLQDNETGRARTLLLRPGLRARIRARFASHYAELEEIASNHGTRILFLRDRFCADDVTRYFHA